MPSLPPRRLRLLRQNQRDPGAGRRARRREPTAVQVAMHEVEFLVADDLADAARERGAEAALRELVTHRDDPDARALADCLEPAPDRARDGHGMTPVHQRPSDVDHMALSATALERVDHEEIR